MLSFHVMSEEVVLRGAMLIARDELLGRGRKRREQQLTVNWTSRLLHSNFSKTVNGCIVLTLSTCCVCSTLFIRTVTCRILPRLLLITANAYTAPAVLLNRFPKATRAKNPLAFAWARLLTATCA